MGLDMYLDKAKRVGNITTKELRAIENYFDYLERPEKYKDCSLKEWCGVDIEEVNMSLVEAYNDEWIHRYSSWDTEKKYGYKTIFESLTSWRKANHIHNWFVENVQDGVDDCGRYEVTKEQLEELLYICHKVIAGSKLVKGPIVNGQTYKNGQWENCYIDGEYIEDPTVAKELLPTTSGFFFGGTEYDQWYYADLKDTVAAIEKVLATTDFEHEIVMYSSSW